MASAQQETFLTEEDLAAEMVRSVRLVQKLRADKASYDKKKNDAIGKEQRKQDAILQEIDMIKAGVQEDLPYSGKDWNEEAGKRDANV